MKDNSERPVKAKSKKFMLYYISTLILLAGIAFIPVREWIRLILNVIEGSVFSGFANENLMIPFTAIVLTLLVGFALLPLLMKASLKKAKIAVCILSVVIFVGSSLFVESMAMKQWDIVNAGIENADDPYAWQAYTKGVEVILFSDGEYLKARTVGMNRSGVAFNLKDGRGVFPGTFRRSLRAEDDDVIQPPYVILDNGVSTPAYLISSNVYTILPVVKIHYYIFSIVLILTLLNFLYNLSAIFTGRREQSDVLFLIVQGLSVACYLIAFLTVKVIRYEHFLTNRIDTGSAISALFCIVMAAVSGGLFAGNHLNVHGKRKLIPPFVSSIIVILLYIAEYLMTGGAFYRYGGGFLFESLPFVEVSAANIIVVLLPALIVFYILELVCKKTQKSMK